MTPRPQSRPGDRRRLGQRLAAAAATVALGAAAQAAFGVTFPLMQLGIIGAHRSVPLTVGGLALWLQADDLAGLAAGAAVATWPDKSGKGCDASQATAANQPAFQENQINGLPALQFNGSTDQMTGCSATWQHFFAVVWIDPAPVTYQYLWGSQASDVSIRRNGGANGYSHGNANDFAQPANYLINGNATDLVGNGAWHIVEAMAASPLTFPNIIGCASGYCGTRNWKGYVAEIVVYQATLASGDAQKIEGYLAWKYGLAGYLPSGHPYKSAAP